MQIHSIKHHISKHIILKDISKLQIHNKKRVCAEER